MSTKIIQTGHAVNALLENLNSQSQIQFVECLANKLTEKIDNEIKNVGDRVINVNNEVNKNFDLIKNIKIELEKIRNLAITLDSGEINNIRNIIQEYIKDINIEGILEKLYVVVNGKKYTINSVVQALAEAPDEKQGELSYDPKTNTVTYKMTLTTGQVVPFIAERQNIGNNVKFVFKTQSFPGVNTPAEFSGEFIAQTRPASVSSLNACQITRFQAFRYTHLTYDLSGRFVAVD